MRYELTDHEWADIRPMLRQLPGLHPARMLWLRVNESMP
jgi:hypothetical protein